MDKENNSKTIPKIPNNYYVYGKDNKPDEKSLVYELWEDGHPDKVIVGQKVTDGDEKTFSEKKLAAEEGLKKTHHYGSG